MYISLISILSPPAPLPPSIVFCPELSIENGEVTVMGEQTPGTTAHYRCEQIHILYLLIQVCLIVKSPKLKKLTLLYVATVVTSSTY